jgi:hypothetical protein
MARTISQIYQEILAEKAKHRSLDSLSNTSNASMWRAIFYVVAVTISVAEQLRDVFQTLMLQMAENLPTGTKRWYAQKLLEYQEGYELSYNRENGEIGYAVTDEEAKILQVATCDSESDTVILKTAKPDGEGGLAPLTVQEHGSVLSYISQYKFAGTIISLLSLEPDLLKVSLKARVNATIINSDGTSVENPDQYPIEDAITNFLKEYGITNFDSTLKIISLIDAIQLVPGVENIVITQAEAAPYGSSDPIDILATSMHTYKAEAGYLNVDPTHLLRNNITYIV